MPDFVYLEPHGAYSYLRGNKIWKSCCSICGKKIKTTSHHIIPRRIHNKCINEALKEVRIRLCRDCEEGMHPENRIISESEVVKRKQNNINGLREAVQNRSLLLTIYPKINQELKELINRPLNSFRHPDFNELQNKVYAPSNKLNQLILTLNSFIAQIDKIESNYLKIIDNGRLTEEGTKLLTQLKEPKSPNPQ